MLITSINNERIKDLIKLKEKKYRDLSDKFLIEGRHLVLEAHKEGKVVELILEKDELFPLDANTLYVSSNVMKKLSDLKNPSNIMALVQKVEEKPIGEKILVLDNIQDPGNLGAIIRSAVAFNFDTIVLSPKTVDLYNSKVLRATQGMVFHINIIMREPVSFMKKIKDEGYKIVGTKVSNGVDVRASRTYSHFALIIGNEGNGIEEELLELCDEYLYIKMNDLCESLNAAVAASILMYEISNK